MTKNAHLSFAELIARRVPVSGIEAAALTLAVLTQLQSRRTSGELLVLPATEHILLSSTGQVYFADAEATPPPSTDVTIGLAQLLRRLLRLDEESKSRSTRVPGGLLMVLARTLGHIDLPALTPAAFQHALTRFTTAEPALLASVFWRAARMRPAAAHHGASDALVRSRRGRDRRTHGPSAGQLRRWLRETERELFELKRRWPVRAMLVMQQRGALVMAGATASILLVAAAGVGLPWASSASRSTTVATLTTNRDVVIAPVDQLASRMAAGDIPLPPGSSRQVVPLARAVADAPRPGVVKRQLARPVVRHVVPRAAARTRARTVNFVNLPRASWIVSN